MKLDVPIAIIIGSIIVAVSVIFNGWYERGLAYNKCVRMIMGILEPSETQLNLADLNNDNNTNINDIVLLINIIMG